MPRFFRLTNVHHHLERMKISKLFRSSRHFQKGIWGATVVLGFAYLITLSALSTRGYRLHELEQKIATLNKENQQLNLSIAELSSPERVDIEVKASGMIAARDVRYMNANTGVLAAR